MRKICIVGIGGIGGFMAFRFGTGEASNDPGKLELSFVARGEHLRAIQKQGLSYYSPSGEKTVIRPRYATDNPSELEVQDLIILCVKGYHLPEVCRLISPIVGEKTTILPLLNGIDIYERIRAVQKHGIVLPACIFVSSTLEGPGIVRHMGGKGNINAGLDPAYPNYGPSPLIAVMQGAGVPFDWQANPLPALWNKYVYIASFALVTGYSGKPIGAVLADPSLKERLLHIIGEIVSLASSKGIPTSPTVVEDVLAKAAPFPYEAKTSYQRDLEVRGKANEGDLFGGTILRLGKELGISTPWTEDTVRKIEGR